MANTFREKTSDGVKVLYDIDFTLGYLDQSHVYVHLATDEYTNQLAYSWINDTQIQLNTAPDNGVVFVIRRVVPRNVPFNDYVDGAILNDKNLDDSFKQALMIQEEIDDGFINATGLIFREDLDMDQNDINNVDTIRTDVLYVNGVVVIPEGTTSVDGKNIPVDLTSTSLVSDNAEDALIELSDKVDLQEATDQQRRDYDRSPILAHPTDFTAGAPPHVITVPAGWTPNDVNTRIWKVDVNGIITEPAILDTTSTTVTIGETLLSTDEIFLGDNKRRNIFDGDPVTNRAKSDVYSTSEADTQDNLRMLITAYLQEIEDAGVGAQTTARSNLGQMTASNLATDAVTTDKIQDGAATFVKLGGFPSQIAAVGEVALPGGLKLQWTQAEYSDPFSGGAVVTKDVALYTPFDNAVLSVMAVCTVKEHLNIVWSELGTTTSNVRVHVRNQSASSLGTVTYKVIVWAIGH